MNNFDYLIAAIFILFVIGLGMSLARTGRNMKDFFAAGGAVPWWISGLSLFMSFFSVGTFVVWGAIAYSDGFVSISIQATMALSGLVVALLIGPAWNRTGCLTVAEYIQKRLGKIPQKLYSGIFIIISLFTTGAFLYPVGKIIEVTTGLDLETAIMLLGVLIIIYTALGGLWAVLVTDVLQFVVLSAAVLLVIPLAFEHIGGVDQFVSNLPAGFTELHNEKYDLLFLVGFFIYNAVFIGGNWAYVQRYTSVSNPKDAKKVGLLFAGLYLIAPIIWMLPPMIYRIIAPDVSGTDAEDAYLLVSKTVLPNGLLGLILGAMVFATASSVNTTINIVSGVITNDLFKALRPKSSQKKLMLVARLSTVAFGLVAIFVALSIKSFGGIVETVLSVAALTGVPIFLPPIWSLFSKFQNAVSILSATVFSLLANLFFKFLAPSLLQIELSRGQEMLFGVLTPVLILAGFEIFLRKTKPDSSVDFSATPVVETAQEDPQENNDSSYGKKVISIGVLGIGSLITVLGVLADKGTAITLTIGVTITLIAVISLYSISKKRRLSAHE
ncbi:MAG: Na+:solute symporter [Shewanella sp.]|nr:Na+:solute symporter [Shewanella sp.]